MQLQVLAALALCLTASALQEQVIIKPTIDDPLDAAMAPTLADLLTIQNSASIFYTYARETELSKLFNDAHSETTVFVPTNSAVMALPRKPHQGPIPVEKGIEISEQEYDERSRKNVEDWVSAHLIPQSPISFNDDRHYDTLKDGLSVSIKVTDSDTNKPAWARVKVNGNVTILGKHEASNGIMYIIDTALSG